jgi:hypothetical protein
VCALEHGQGQPLRYGHATERGSCLAVIDAELAAQGSQAPDLVAR